MAIARPAGAEFDLNWPESAECLTLDFGPFEPVHKWKRMPGDCSGVRFVGEGVVGICMGTLWQPW
jgi:hypothetical protein